MIYKFINYRYKYYIIETRTIKLIQVPYVQEIIYCTYNTCICSSTATDPV